MPQHTTPEVKIEWTSQDAHAANAQGWNIFTTSRDVQTESDLVGGKPYGHRPFELQRLDETARFESDEQAWRHVLVAFRAGDHLAVKALAFLQQHSPLEHEAIFQLN